MAESDEKDRQMARAWSSSVLPYIPSDLSHTIPVEVAYAQGLADERERIVGILLRHRGHRGIALCIRDRKL